MSATVELSVPATEITAAEIEHNRHRARNLCLIVGLVHGLIVGVIVATLTTPLVGLIAFVVVGLLAALIAWSYAPSYTRRRIGGTVVSAEDYHVWPTWSKDSVPPLDCVLPPWSWSTILSPTRVHWASTPPRPSWS